MYFLDGDHIYIHPENKAEVIEDQINNCISQLSKINSGKIIYKVNIFINSETNSSCESLKKKVYKKIYKIVGSPFILSFISQPPLTCKVIAEVFYYNPKIWNGTYINHKTGEAILFEHNNTRVLIGSIISDQDIDTGEQAENAFLTLKDLLNKQGFAISSIIRQWNYIKNIYSNSSGKQNYQEFNNVRSRYYGNAFEQVGYPAATGIGMSNGGIIVEFIALDSEIALTRPIDNPEQVSAHCYSRDVLVGKEDSSKTTPKFERARFLDLFKQKVIFISGTAAIKGEKTVGLNNPAEQTEITIHNIKQLFSKEIIDSFSVSSNSQYGHARVYIRNREDFNTISNIFRNHFTDLPVVYLQADICRDELLVEIEGEVILK
ncbi:MAG: hypothetical protein JXR31_00930 [Prolixibacteraceae bacterium]|nr:hypothetical protein [Prolixibacteraceae bacterium]MBN2772779.1 hypothetical protein [Prolixibacteraceae bacterium]